tara:strand:- start:1265 stop:1396 length:132 start_codon:yes stop_codon:yes gene_type:complete
MHTALSRKSIRLGNSLVEQPSGHARKIDIDECDDRNAANECAN